MPKPKLNLDAQTNRALDSDAAQDLIDSLAPPRKVRKELVIDQKTGRVRQAGAVGAEGRWVAERRTKCERDLFYFLRTIFNMHWLHPPLHLPVCRWVQKTPPRSKALMMPRNHCKCYQTSFFRERERRVQSAVNDDGNVVYTKRQTATNGRRPVYRVETFSGRAVVVTSNHPFLRWGGSWQTLDEGLQVNDWVGIVRRGVFGGADAPRRAAIAGWMIADGDLVGMSLSADNPAERQRFINLCHEEGWTNVRESGNRVLCSGMRDWWRLIGLEGKRSAHKYVPEFVLQGTQKTVRAFLQELFHDATEKSGRTEGGITYSTTSERLADDVQHLLTKFGLHSVKRRLEDKTGRHRPRGYVWYQVTFTDTVELFTEQPTTDVGRTWSDRFPPEWRTMLRKGEKGRLRKEGIRIDNEYGTSRAKVRRAAEFLQHDELLHWTESDVGWEPITAIVPLGEHETISVETPEHTLTDGDIVTHNSTIVAQGVPPHMLIQPAEYNIYFPGLPGASTRILMVGEAEERIADHYRPIKQAFESNEYLRAFWPHIMWDSPKNQAPSWNNSELIVNRPDNYPDPSIRAIGVGGATTGAHPNVMIKDDLTTEKAMNEPPTMAKALEWNRNSRALFEDPLKSLEFFTFTRWAVTDLAADIEKDASVAMNTRWRQLVEDGTVIYPSKFGDDPDVITKLLVEKHGTVMFALQYMNSVIQSGLTDFNEDDLRFFRLIGQQLEFEETDADDRLAQEMNHVAKKEGEPHRATLRELQSLRGLKLSDPRVIEASRMRYIRQVRGG